MKNFLIWITIGLSIALGIFFRFSDIEKKVFWKDEVITEFAIAGRNPAIETGRLLNKSEMLQAVRLDSTSSQKEVIGTLAMNAAEQGPLYYVLARAWCDLFGAEPYQLRLFSVLIGTLLIAATFFLGWELFDTSLAGGIAAALVAVSPFHLAYSQQARPYILWELFMVLASIALMRAVKKSTITPWAVYAASLTLSVYTQLLAATFLIGQCAFMAFWQKLRIDKRFLLALGAILLAFAPWLIMVPEHQTKSNWLSAPNLNLIEYLRGLYTVFGCAFYDGDTTPYTAPDTVAIIVTLIGVLAFAFVLDYLLDKDKRAGAKYALTLLIVPALCVVSNDLIKHSCAGFYDRYLTPMYLAISLCLAGGISHGIKSEKPLVRKLMAAAFALFLILGLISCVHFHETKVWHQHGASLQKLADQLNDYPAPIVVIDKTQPDVAITLCRLLRDDARLMINPTADSAAPNTDYFQVHMLNGPSNPWKCNLVSKRQTDAAPTTSPTTAP